MSATRAHPRSPFVRDGQVIEMAGEKFEVAVPEGLVLVDLAAQRMARRLHQAGRGVDALLAPVAPLAAGCSARVDASRRFASEERALVPWTGDPTGCLVRRSGTVGAGSQLFGDPDVVCQAVDDLVTGPTVDAVPEGRPVLTSRPVVLLVAVGTDPAVADLGRTWTNELMERGIEARLAVDHPAPGVHLSSPCRPGPATMAALRPDVVVALDPAAVRQVRTWSFGSHVTEIHLDDDAVTEDPARYSLVSWRLGEASGRLRCRVGRDVDIDVLEGLIDRFCGLPPRRDLAQLEADRPGRRASAVDLLPRRRSSRPRVTSIEIVGRARSELEAAWWDGIADQFAALGCAIHHAADAASRETPDLRLWGTPSAASTHRPGASGLAALLVSHVDLTEGGQVGTDALRAARSVGAALTASPSVECHLTGSGVPVRRLPHFVGREHLRDLRAAAVAARGRRLPVVGWEIAGEVPSRDLDTVADALSGLVGRRRDLRVRTTGGDSEAVDARLLGALERQPSDPGSASEVADQRVQIWTPAQAHLHTTGHLGRAVEAMLARVPVVAAPDAARSLGRLGRAVATPTDPDDASSWSVAIEAALDGHGVDPDRTQIQARLLHGDQAAAVRGHRILGWLTRVTTR